MSFGGSGVMVAGTANALKIGSAVSRRLGEKTSSGTHSGAREVSAISTAAEITLDDDKLTRLVDRCITGGVLIGIGGLAVPSVQDVQATDTTILGPELLYAGRILVTD